MIPKENAKRFSYINVIKQLAPEKDRLLYVEDNNTEKLTLLAKRRGMKSLQSWVAPETEMCGQRLMK